MTRFVSLILFLSFIYLAQSYEELIFSRYKGTTCQGRAYYFFQTCSCNYYCGTPDLDVYDGCTIPLIKEATWNTACSYQVIRDPSQTIDLFEGDFPLSRLRDHFLSTDPCKPTYLQFGETHSGGLSNLGFSGLTPEEKQKVSDSTSLSRMRYIKSLSSCQIEVYGNFEDTDLNLSIEADFSPNLQATDLQVLSQGMSPVQLFLRIQSSTPLGNQALSFSSSSSNCGPLVGPSNVIVNGNVRVPLTSQYTPTLVAFEKCTINVQLGLTSRTVEYWLVVNPVLFGLLPSSGLTLEQLPDGVVLSRSSFDESFNLFSNLDLEPDDLFVQTVPIIPSRMSFSLSGSVGVGLDTSGKGEFQVGVDLDFKLDKLKISSKNSLTSDFDQLPNQPDWQSSQLTIDLSGWYQKGISHDLSYLGLGEVALTSAISVSGSLILNFVPFTNSSQIELFSTGNLTLTDLNSRLSSKVILSASRGLTLAGLEGGAYLDFRVMASDSSCRGLSALGVEAELTLRWNLLGFDPVDIQINYFDYYRPDSCSHLPAPSPLLTSKRHVSFGELSRRDIISSYQVAPDSYLTSSGGYVVAEVKSLLNESGWELVSFDQMLNLETPPQIPESWTDFYPSLSCLNPEFCLLVHGVHLGPIPSLNESDWWESSSFLSGIQLAYSFGDQPEIITGLLGVPLYPVTSISETGEGVVALTVDMDSDLSTSDRILELIYLSSDQEPFIMDGPELSVNSSLPLFSNLLVDLSSTGQVGLLYYYFEDGYSSTGLAFQSLMDRGSPWMEPIIFQDSSPALIQSYSNGWLVGMVTEGEGYYLLQYDSDLRYSIYCQLPEGVRSLNWLGEVDSKLLFWLVLADGSQMLSNLLIDSSSCELEVIESNQVSSLSPETTILDVNLINCFPSSAEIELITDQPLFSLDDNSTIEIVTRREIGFQTISLTSDQPICSGSSLLTNWIMMLFG